MKLPVLIGLEGLQNDGKGVLTFVFNGRDGAKHYVPVAEGVLNALAAPLLMASRELDAKAKGKPVDAQPLTLTGFTIGLDDLGRPMLRIVMDRLPFHVLLPEGSIPALRSALGQLDALAKPPSTDAKH